MSPPWVRGPYRTDTEFCIEALEDAFRLHGRPEIFNTDQGSQFTSPRFTQPLLDATVRVSPLGRLLRNRLPGNAWTAEDAGWTTS